jgi:uncharacterized membrane protein
MASSSPRLPLLIVSAAYAFCIPVMLLWIGQALHFPALGPLDPRSFIRLGWLLPVGLLLAFLRWHLVPGAEWIASQFLWLSRSFLGLIGAGIAAVACIFLGAMFQAEFFVVVAIAFWALGGLWFLYRLGRGLICLVQRRPVRGTAS